MRIVFLCYSLAGGGAERQLAALACGLAARDFVVDVVTYYPGGAFEQVLQNAGVGVHCVHKRGRADLVTFFFRLTRIVRRLKPHLLHSYLGSPNVLAVLLRPFLRGRPKVVWGVRASNMDLNSYDWLWRLSYRLERRLSRFCDCIITNSVAGETHAVINGFPANKFNVIFNGIEPEAWQILENGERERFRVAHGLPIDRLVVGIVGRLDPMKGHRQFLAAMALLRREYPQAHAVCIGGGSSDYLADLCHHAAELGLGEHVSWLGPIGDMEAAYNAIDVLVSSSLFGEGFSNVICEAMACGVPCVVTDVGDSRTIVGDLCPVVRPGDEAALALALADLCRDLNKVDREALRRRIVDNFGLGRMIDQTELVLSSLMADAG